MTLDIGNQERRVSNYFLVLFFDLQKKLLLCIFSLIFLWELRMMTITKHWMYLALVTITTAGKEDLRPRSDCVGSHFDRLLALRGPP